MAPITVTIDKGKGSKLGASFDIDSGCVIISRIQKGGWFHGTELSEGHEIISINGEACYGLSVDNVEQLLINAPGTATILADDPMDTQRRRINIKL